jgi:hypothetical protein
MPASSLGTGQRRLCILTKTIRQSLEATIAKVQTEVGGPQQMVEVGTGRKHHDVKVWGIAALRSV